MKYDVTLAGVTKQLDLSRRGDGWVVSLDGGPPMAVTAQAVDGLTWRLDGPELGRHQLDVAVRGEQAFVLDGHEPLPGTVVDPRSHALDLAGGAGAGVVKTQMPGAVVRVVVAVGASVSQGQVLLVVEAMKMENEFKSPCDGVVVSIEVAAGQAVEAGATLIVIEPSEA